MKTDHVTLREHAEAALLAHLRTHKWTAAVVREVAAEGYLVVSAVRGAKKHIVAVASAAAGTAVLTALGNDVEHIFVNGQLDQVGHHGCSVPISHIDDFFETLLGWNKDSADGQFVSADVDEVRPVSNARRVIRSENPIHEVWARLRQLHSVKLAEKTISARATTVKATIDAGALRAKAEGLAFAVRNATDYFRLKEDQTVSQRVLNLYYGTLSFAFAEMLAGPAGTKTLADLEDMTKQGHGLYTVDGTRDGIDALVVGVIASGFFPNWLAFLGKPVKDLPTKKPREPKDLGKQAPGTFASLEQLFARVPEVSDLFVEIFDGPPAWLLPLRGSEVVGAPGGVQSSAYVHFLDQSGRFNQAAVAALSPELKEITEVSSTEPGRAFRVRIDFPSDKSWDHGLSLHHSPYTADALIAPLFNSITEFRVIALVLLYGLSIVVRYRPSIWRRVQEGDLDQFKVLVESFLTVVERVLPEQFLATILGVPVYARQQGAS